MDFTDLQLTVEKEELTQALASELASSSKLKVIFLSNLNILHTITSFICFIMNQIFFFDPHL